MELHYRLLRIALKGIVGGPLRGCLSVEGQDGIPGRGGLIVVANHFGTADPVLVGHIMPRDDLHYMVKSESFRRLAPRLLLRWFHGFPVVRHSADRAAIRRALGLLRDGHALLLFPEGSRSADARVRRAEAGAGFIARHSGAPIVAVSLWGTDRIMPKGAWLPRRARGRIVCSAPFHLPERTPGGRPLSNQEAADLMLARVASQLPAESRGPYAGPMGVDAIVGDAATRSQ